MLLMWLFSCLGVLAHAWPFLPRADSLILYSSTHQMESDYVPSPRGGLGESRFPKGTRKVSLNTENFS